MLPYLSSVCSPSEGGYKVQFNLGSLEFVSLLPSTLMLMMLSEDGWLGEGDGWPHGRLFPWVETILHQTTLHQPPPLLSPPPTADGWPEMRPAVLLLLLQHGLDRGFCLILKQIRVPGLVWSGRYHSSWGESLDEDENLMVGTPPCTATLTLKVKSSTLWNGTRWVFFVGNFLVRTQKGIITGLKWNNHKYYCTRVVKRCFGGFPPS